jgi:hypothetical protein
MNIPFDDLSALKAKSCVHYRNLTARRSRHRVCLKNRRPWFETHQCYKIFFWGGGIVCVLKNEIKGLAQK